MPPRPTKSPERTAVERALSALDSRRFERSARELAILPVLVRYDRRILADLDRVVQYYFDLAGEGEERFYPEVIAVSKIRGRTADAALDDETIWLQVVQMLQLGKLRPAFLRLDTLVRVNEVHVGSESATMEIEMAPVSRLVPFRYLARYRAVREGNVVAFSFRASVFLAAPSLVQYLLFPWLYTFTRLKGARDQARNFEAIARYLEVT